MTVIEKYLARYPHLEAVVRNANAQRSETARAACMRQFAQRALLLAIPEGVTGKELLELDRMSRPARGGWKNPASAANGRKGGRPRKASN